MKNGLKIDELAKEILARIADHVNKPETVRNYKIALRKICRFFSEKGYDEYDQAILMQFLENLRYGKSQYGVPYSKGFISAVERTVFIVAKFAEEGVFDFSYRPNNKKLYSISDYHQSVVTDIMDKNELTQSIRNDLDHVFRHIFWFIENKGLTVEQITDDLLLEFVFEEMPRTVKYTTDRTMRVVKMTAAYLKDNKIGNVHKDFSLLKVRGHRENIINPFSTEDVNSILNTLENSDKYDKRDLAIVLLAYDTGLRWCDVRNLKLEDIDWKNACLSVVQKKTSQPITLPLSGKTMNAIADYILNERPESEFKNVFLTKTEPPRPFGKNCTKSFKKAVKESGISVKGQGFHSLRRAYATEMSNSNVPLETISQMLGHRSTDEDKPYLTYNREKISFLTFDFSLVPLSSRFYLDKEDV